MVNGEELLDCILSVDEILSDVETALNEKKYTIALHKLREARDALNDLREDDEAEDDRQEVEMHMDRKLM